ncbi:MAG: transporter [Tatlockia sp.]|nr:transporter [Tatlockia sp.]
MLSLTDRPTAASSPCTIPIRHAVVELGFQGDKLIEAGQAQSYPAPEFRVGLPGNNEIYALLPNYNHQTVPHASGFGPTSIGFKHIINYTDDWIFTVEGVLTPPSGSTNFGSPGLAGTLNEILAFNLNKKLSMTYQLGISTETDVETNGGQRFISINPVLILAWSPTDKLQFYGSVYGKTKTSAEEGRGFIAATGLVYLLTKNMTIDVEGGQRINGSLGGTENYYGLGTALLF